MITVDDRRGSAELVPFLRHFLLPITVGRLTFGDISFLGKGPEGCPIPVGIEVKTVRDILSCITDGRFSGHQLPGLIQSYLQPWLLICGTMRANPLSGLLELQGPKGRWYEATVGQRRFMWRDLETWLLTVQVKGGLSVHRCSNWGEATAWISTLYHWWTSKEWEEHRGHLSLHNPDNGLFDRALLVRPTLCRMVAAQLPGIGQQKSLEVSNYFGTVLDMVNSDISSWTDINGIGRTIAERVYNGIRSKS